MLRRADQQSRSCARRGAQPDQLAARLPEEELQARKLGAELAIIDKGITFTVYSDGENNDRA